MAQDNGHQAAGPADLDRRLRRVLVSVADLVTLGRGGGFCCLPLLPADALLARAICLTSGDSLSILDSADADAALHLVYQSAHFPVTAAGSSYPLQRLSLAPAKLALWLP